MAQIRLYLDEDTAKQVQLVAHAAGVSNSKWVARLIRTELASTWPAEFQELAGAWRDCPDLREIRENQGADAPREQL